MSVQLDNLNAQIAALNTAVASVADHVKNDPATAELAATNAGIDTVTATLTNVVSELNALLVVPPAPVPPVA